MNRGDVTACYYFSRKPEPRPKQPQPEPSSLPVSDSGQARIDHLEQLVLTLLKETRSKQNQIHTPSTSIDADHDESLEDANADSGRCDDASGPSETQTTTLRVRSGTVININSDYKERLSVDEAQWGLLLNEVGGSLNFSNDSPNMERRSAKFVHISMPSASSMRNKTRSYLSCSEGRLTIQARRFFSVRPRT